MRIKKERVMVDMNYLFFVLSALLSFGCLYGFLLTKNVKFIALACLCLFVLIFSGFIRFTTVLKEIQERLSEIEKKESKRNGLNQPCTEGRKEKTCS